MVGSCSGTRPRRSSTWVPGGKRSSLLTKASIWICRHLGGLASRQPRSTRLRTRDEYEQAAHHLGRAHELGDAAGRSNPYAFSLLAVGADLAFAGRGRTGDVRTAVEIGIHSVLPDRPLDPALGWLAAHGLRAEADAAVGARARHDTAAIASAEGRADRIIRTLETTVTSRGDGGGRPERGHPCPAAPRQTA